MIYRNIDKDYFAYPLIPLLLTGESEEEIQIKYDSIKKRLSNNIDIKELALELSHSNISSSYRAVVIYNENTKQYDLAFDNTTLPKLRIIEERPIVFMFAGIGNQYINMARGIYEKIPFFRESFDYCCNFLEPILKKNLKEVVFYGADSAEDSSSEDNISKEGFDFRKLLDKSEFQSTEKNLLDKTEYLHPLLFIIEYSLAQMLIQWGISPKALIGHSVGEYVAATISGVLSIDDALILITRRAQLIEKLSEGMMMTLLASKEEVEEILQKNDRLSLAIENSPISCTISGTEEDIMKLEEELEEKDMVFFRLPTDRAFHSRLMEPIESDFRALFENIKINQPKIPFLSNLTGDWATYAQVSDSRNWFLHTCRTVQFSEGIKKMLDINDSVLIEIGPGQTLAGFIYQHKFNTNNLNTVVLSALRNVNDGTPDNIYLLNTLCKLWINGGKVDWHKILNV